MKRTIIAIVLVIMAMTMSVSAQAVDAATSNNANDAMVTEVAAPAGYCSCVDCNAVTELDPPIAAYSMHYIDAVALSKGYTIDEHDSSIIRAYSKQDDGRTVHVVITQELATVCVHSDNDLPGAIMGVWVHMGKNLLFTTVDCLELLFV